VRVVAILTSDGRAIDPDGAKAAGGKVTGGFGRHGHVVLEELIRSMAC